MKFGPKLYAGKKNVARQFFGRNGDPKIGNLENQDCVSLMHLVSGSLASAPEVRPAMADEGRLPVGMLARSARFYAISGHMLASQNNNNNKIRPSSFLFKDRTLFFSRYNHFFQLCSRFWMAVDFFFSTILFFVFWRSIYRPRSFHERNWRNQ
jgi:hypothetical protein